MSKLVTLEQAKKLKELGYDSDRFAFRFDIVGDMVEVGINYEDNVGYKVFYIHEALEWFREVKGIVCWVQFEYNDGAMWYGTIIQKDEQMTPLHTESFDTHSEAESALLDALIEYVSK